MRAFEANALNNLKKKVTMKVGYDIHWRTDKLFKDILGRIFGA